MSALFTSGKTLQSLIWLGWILLWAGLFVWAARRGARNLGIPVKDLFVKSSDEIAMERLERLKRENPEEYRRLLQLEREVAENAEPLS